VAAGAGSNEKRGTGKRRRTGKKKVSKRTGGGSTAAGGADRLKEAVDRKLRRSSGVLATLLMDKARAGDIPSLRLLVSLGEHHKPKAKVVEVRPFFSQALAWGAEPQWVDPPEEEEQVSE
jgi:hypothetical protein